MPKILVIDDEPQMRALLQKVLVKNDFEVAFVEDGASGLREAKLFHPDLIILDIIMPGMDGFEVARKLQNDPSCAHIPIMVLTALATSYGRETALEAGADDFVTKPFSLEDIVAKAKALTDETKSSPNSPTKPLKTRDQARLISVHSLRGGLGCTTMAINLAFTLNNLWHKPTLLLDGDFASGQVAMALHLSEGLSWTDLLRSSASNSVHRSLEDESIAHESGLHILAAPRDPGHADRFSSRLLEHTLRLMEHRYDYVIADLAHDFRGNTLEILKQSEQILYLLSPENISQQFAVKALDAYDAMGIKEENIELILVETRPGNAIKVSDIEKFIGRSLSAYVPFAPEMTLAINQGLPFTQAYPSHAISTLTEDLAYLLSKPSHKYPTQPKQNPSSHKPRPQLSRADQNGANHRPSNSLLKRMGLVR